MAGAPNARFDIGTYESQKSPSPYIDYFKKDASSDFYINDAAQDVAADGAAIDQSLTTPTLLEPSTMADQMQRHEIPSFPQHHSQARSRPQEVYPKLKLSGRIISASICARYALGIDDHRQWALNTRSGTSALFDHLASLSGPSSQWDHTLVAWTGEISQIEKKHLVPGGTVVSEAKGAECLTATSAAPVPLDTNLIDQLDQPRPGLRLSRREREDLERRLWHDTAGQTVPVWLYDESQEGKDTVAFTDQSRWRHYAEHELYTLLHYKLNEPTDGRTERKWWADYCRANQKFADRIAEIYKPGDIVWVHDYHLMLLPRLLRQRMPNIYVGFFLHTPFPTSELFRGLKSRDEILMGVLGANMIGFQTQGYCRHFSSSCTRVLGFTAQSSGIDANGAHIAVDKFPIGIDAYAIETEAFGSSGINERIETLRKQYQGLKIIVGRDRLDSVRGVSQKLMSYAKLLGRYPEWRNRVILIQITSTTSIDEGKENRKEKIDRKISALVARINGQYGSINWTPVLHFPRFLPRDDYFALLRMADVGIVTSVRDGMSSTAMEYIIAQKEKHSPLILSEFSGTAVKLIDATIVNPWDHADTAECIHNALMMDKESKAAIHERLYKCVTTETVQMWSKDFLGRLLVNLMSFHDSIATPPLDKVELLLQYRKANRRLFMFDYDGTLTPIVKHPHAAIPSDRVIRTIKKLAQDPHNNVWIISGRDQNFLDEWMGHIPELGLSAEHGSFIRLPYSEEWVNLAVQMDMGWQNDVLKVFQRFTDRTQGSFIERKKIAVTWHYRRTDPEFGAFQAHECKRQLEKVMAKHWDIEIMDGKANLEVRPRFLNKGEIAKRLVAAYRKHTEAGAADGECGPDFVLCLGDDFTDEDMFKTLRDCGLPKETIFSCIVGASSKKTLANWHLREPSDVIATVAFLNGRPSATDPAAIEAVQARLNGAALIS